jgi:molecular chaperone GrpE
MSEPALDAQTPAPLDLEAEAPPSPSEAEPEAKREPERGDEPSDLAATLRTELAAIRAELASRAAYDRFKEEQIERLHAELQSHKNDLLRKLVEPWVVGVIKLHDQLGQQMALWRTNGLEEVAVARLIEAFDQFREDVALFLERQGVEPFEVAGEDFDPQRQTALRRLPAPEPAQLGRVAERLRPGFEQGAQVIQKERVAVYVAVPEAAVSAGGRA